MKKLLLTMAVLMFVGMTAFAQDVNSGNKKAKATSSVQVASPMAEINDKPTCDHSKCDKSKCDKKKVDRKECSGKKCSKKCKESETGKLNETN